MTFSLNPAYLTVGALFVGWGVAVIALSGVTARMQNPLPPSSAEFDEEEERWRQTQLAVREQKRRGFRVIGAALVAVGAIFLALALFA